ncbi:anti-sigma factor [Leptobacterium flavescens]|uniref:Anti-sigma factor n=1 Tax=Leptobacterium flavescens TaxID=472055 RepID=A0A6P0UKH3_9FLAO|nr:FecR domain-containing protein [Leptobacterium flavescens]NER13795.1 anti-sigma factor [Leptobacterium flavescens]
MAKREFKSIEDFIEDASFVNWVNKENLSDINFWEKWIEEHPDQLELVLNAKAVVNGIQFKKTPHEAEKTEARWESLINAIENKTENDIPSLKKRTAPLYRYISIAASICALMVLGWLYQSSLSKNEIIHQTKNGEFINLRLPDGTNLTLNANSEIRYQKNNPRKVWLKGEAYFRVKKKPSAKAKFQVMTDDLTVEVYGTEFNVNSRHQKTDVILDEGAINIVLSDGSVKEMIPGEFISFSAESETLLTRKKVEKPEVLTSWKDGTLILDQLSLQEVMTKIEDIYGTPAEFADEISATKVISGGIPTENFEICIMAIEKAANVRIDRDNNTLLIMSNN